MIYKVSKDCTLTWLNYRVELRAGDFVRGEQVVKGWLDLDGRRIILDDIGLETALAVDGLLMPVKKKRKRAARGKAKL